LLTKEVAEVLLNLEKVGFSLNIFLCPSYFDGTNKLKGGDI